MSSIHTREKKVIDFWEQNDIFAKSVTARSHNRPYVFYDGPPFATGLPHYGHVVASLLKDVVPRYWTMRGYRVERVWGWDCHGLPIENIVEEKLNLKTKKDIEELGVGEFNKACSAQVLAYAEEWKKTIRRMGRWVDMEHPYMTMDLSYMESVWWVFSELWKKGLIYEGRKAMHICPRCVTPLSNFEVTQGYKEIVDASATAAFSITNGSEKLGINEPLSILAWTTTPWTLPGNVLLAVGNDITYVIARVGRDDIGASLTILARDRVQYYEQKIQEKTKNPSTVFEILATKKGSELIGLEYEPLFPYFASNVHSFRVVAADFVSTEDGTGVVHIAPAFGEDDYQVGLREGAGFVQHITMEGRFTDGVSDFKDREVKPKDTPAATDRLIIAFLEKQGRIFFQEKYVHSYPHCWRCDTPLLNYATTSWFVRVTELKEDLLANNELISWVPEHMKEGRFGKWLENARDWAISRNRYWGTPLPIWKSDDGDVICVQSANELSELAKRPINDLHKHVVDMIEIEKDGKVYRRIPEVLDCWFESGAMPYGQVHYPFENKEKFEKGFPAEFIAEGQDQTRGWFYTLHVLATALTRGSSPSIPSAKKTVPAFTHVIVNGIVLAEDGKKMSKRLKNYPAPDEIFEKYGADALRFYLVSSPVMHAESLNFSQSGVRETYNKIINTLGNVFQFYSMFADSLTHDSPLSAHVLDRWILSRLSSCLEEVTASLHTYHLTESTQPIQSFIADLSQWYLRRSRDRFKADDAMEKSQALHTLRHVLFVTSKMIAPFTPFLAEEIYQGVKGVGNKAEESVHLEDWPEATMLSRDEKLEKQMERLRKVVEIGHALRATAGMKVRQPLSRIVCNQVFAPELQSVLCEELNIKEVQRGGDTPNKEEFLTQQEGELFVALQTTLTPELREEGLYRELVRVINAGRKEQGLTINDTVQIVIAASNPEIVNVIEKYNQELMRATLASRIQIGESAAGGVEAKVGGDVIVFRLII